MRWFMLGGFAVMGFLTRGGNDNSDQPQRAASEVPALLQLNITDLRGSDIDRLQGLRVRIAGDGSAIFETKDFSVDGNVTMYTDNSGSQFAQGDLCFKIPGLDVNAEGSFVLPNQTSADDKTKMGFEKIFGLLRQEVSDVVPDIEHIVSSIAKAIQAGNASDTTKDGKAVQTGEASNVAKIVEVGLSPRDLQKQPSVQRRQRPGHGQSRP